MRYIGKQQQQVRHTPAEHTSTDSSNNTTNGRSGTQTLEQVTSNDE